MGLKAQELRRLLVSHNNPNLFKASLLFASLGMASTNFSENMTFRKESSSCRRVDRGKSNNVPDHFNFTKKAFGLLVFFVKASTLAN